MNMSKPSQIHLSKIQLGIFFESIANPESTVYNCSILEPFDKSTDISGLKKATESVISAHQGLKTRITYNTAGEPVFDFTSDIDVRIIPLSDEEFDARRPFLVHAFNLIDSPLARFEIYTTPRSNYLFIDIHHVIFDGTSFVIMSDEITKACAGDTLNDESYSPIDLVLEEDSLYEREREVARKYYDPLLSDIDTGLIPIRDVYGTAPASDTYESEFTIDAAAFKTLRHTLHISTTAFFTAVMGFVTAKFTGADESLITTVYNGRDSDKKKSLISMLVRTMPHVVKAGAGKTVAQLLHESMDELAETKKYSAYSFVDIARDYGITSDICFTYQGNLDNIDVVRDGVSPAIRTFNPRQLEISKIILEIYDHSADTYKIHLRWRTDYYTRSFIESFIRSYIKTVHEFLVKERLCDVETADDTTLDILDRFNQTVHEYDRTKTLIDLFDEQVKQQPDAPAVICNDTALTYAELDDLSERLAYYIHTKGIGVNDFVSILVPRNEFMAITALGVTKSGAAYQPLDATYPADRLNFMASDSGARLVIADRTLLPLLSEYHGDVLYTDEIAHLPASPNRLSAFRPKPDDAIIILYTSGTTGTPKGCILEHKNIAGYYQTYKEMMHLTPQSRVASYASFGFDAGLMDIFTTFAAGSSFYILDDTLRFDLPALDEYFIKCNITNVFMTTQVGRMFAGMTKCQSLKYMLVGGEKLVPFTPPKAITFLNGYGPSEATCCITCEQVIDDTSLQTIGKPHYNTKLYVIDKYMHRLPVGAAGELCAAGVQIGRGYLNRPDKTAEVFVTNPFCTDEEYTKMYCTGDVVRLLPDGRVEFIGRTDGQVKIRGFRVELTEVEQVIREFAGIKDATVAAFDDDNGGKFIAAYVVSTESDAVIDTESLSSFIASRKPAYMVPASIMQIESIPLTVNAKVDKKKLPKPVLSAKREGTPASNPLEEKLCGIFAKVLGLDTVYADDDFFAIGGTSISASKVAMLCYNEGLNIVYKNIFDNHTPQSLALFAAASSQESMPVSNTDKVLPSTPEQTDVLSCNTTPHLNAIKTSDIGVVLLTGATGYLGIHVLKELLDTGCEKIICLVHKAKNQNARDRLRVFMMYYFGGLIDEQMFERITVVEGDITDDQLTSSLASYTFDTIINCAASVKHFASDDSIEKINYTGVQNLIKIAFEHNAQLIQTSTLSVCGSSVETSDGVSHVLFENSLNIGQELNNKYISSKYMAEQAVFDAVQKGLKAKVMRLGNLMSRNFDGEFQMNSATNNFMRTMRAYKKLGVFPVTQLASPVEFSPIDVVAKAIVLLSTSPSQFTVFHVNNCHQVHMANIIEVFNELGMPIEIVSEEMFSKRFSEVMNNDAANVDISCLLSYLNNAGEKVIMNESNNAYTVNALYRLGFSWPLTDMAYIRRTVKGLQSLRYFN
ncbi:MAG TPA: amino acid adenylation domain-containing protein [Methanocorpusculum sp.]|nr:amino acid adenylation domain-containing protein [Methanocorpusculum sp.]